MGTPSTRSRTSLIHSRRGPSEPMLPVIGRVVHLPFMPSLGSVGAGISDGVGASQFGGDQTLPGAFSVLRNSWHEARAILVPPDKNSASTTLMRMPSRTSFVVTSTGVRMFGSRNMSTVSRDGTKSSEPWRSSIAKASRPTTTRPCMELGSHTPFETWLGMKTSWRLVKKGWFFIAGDHDGIRATKSRAGGAMRPFRTYGFIGFAARCLLRQCRECVLTIELRQRPHRRPADQRAFVIQ